MVQEDHVKKLAKWEPKPESKGVLLYGEPGRGKSALCKALINRWATEEYRALFITIGDALDNIRNAFDDEQTSVGQELDKLRKPGLLVIDDFGTEKLTEFVDEKFFAIFDWRGRHKKHTFLSTNLTLAELKKRYSPRVFDRLFEYCSFLECGGPSYRQKNFENQI